MIVWWFTTPADLPEDTDFTSSSMMAVYSPPRIPVPGDAVSSYGLLGHCMQLDVDRRPQSIYTDSPLY